MTDENADSFEVLTYSELNEVIENDTTDNNYKTAATFLLEAVEDWPTYNLEEPSDFIAELKAGMRGDLTYDSLNEYRNKLWNSSWEENADWKATAIAELLELFDFERKGVFDRTITLEAIIDKMTKYYRHK